MVKKFVEMKILFSYFLNLPLENDKLPEHFKRQLSDLEMILLIRD